MTNLTENEMAAIAGRLWEPCHVCNRQDKHYNHEAAPDMHDPANLWRALENQSGQWLVDFSSGYYNCMLSKPGQSYRSIRGRTKAAGDAVFAALVALYKAENPCDADDAQAQAETDA